MHLKDGRDIFESDKYPGYYIESETGNYCNEKGNYIGGNYSKNDLPGGNGLILGVPDIVYVSETGKQYYPYKNKKAVVPVKLEEVQEKGYIPSAGYIHFVNHIWKREIASDYKNRKYYGKTSNS